MRSPSLFLQPPLAPSRRPTPSTHPIRRLDQERETHTSRVSFASNRIDYKLVAYNGAEVLASRGARRYRSEGDPYRASSYRTSPYRLTRIETRYRTAVLAFVAGPPAPGAKEERDPWIPGSLLHQRAARPREPGAGR